ncbi:MAG: AMP-binding protein [Succinivibrio sp.]|nr:AMP-binding protein [Succinivibrio sp.]
MADVRTPWYQSYPKDVPYTIDKPPYQNLGQMFDDVCNKYGKRKAFISFNSAVTFLDVKKATDNLAAYLQHCVQVKKGEKLAVILPNVIQYPVSVFAGLKCGMQIVNINPLYTTHEILGVLRDSKAKVVICLASINNGLQKILDQTYLEHVISCGVGDMLPVLKGSVINFAFRHLTRQVKPYDKKLFTPFKSCLYYGKHYRLQPVECAFDDIAFLQYTGGTTGKPKGAMLSHGNILSNVFQCHAMYGPRVKLGCESILTALPLYHIFAMTINLMYAMYIGATNLLIVDPRKFENLITQLRKYPKISIITGVNTLFNAFVHYSVFDRVNLSSLNLVVGGGTAVQEGVAARFLEASGGIPILEGYGLTECSPLCCVVPYTEKKYSGTIGIPIPSTQARIVDIQTGEEITDLSHSGELQFKGPQVMKGYFLNEKETANVFEDGWLKTGDIAQWCEGSYIKIIDRLKDMIIVSGFNVFPNEIENVVSTNNKVLECAVVGVPSSTSGESIKLFVVRKDRSLTKEELLDYCRKFLTGYKLPKHIEFVEQLPKSAVGKVMRRYLRQNRFNG